MKKNWIVTGSLTALAVLGGSGAALAEALTPQPAVESSAFGASQAIPTAATSVTAPSAATPSAATTTTTTTAATTTPATDQEQAAAATTAAAESHHRLDRNHRGHSDGGECPDGGHCGQSGDRGEPRDGGQSGEPRRAP